MICVIVKMRLNGYIARSTHFITSHYELQLNTSDHCVIIWIALPVQIDRLMVVELYRRYGILFPRFTSLILLNVLNFDFYSHIRVIFYFLQPNSLSLLWLTTSQIDGKMNQLKKNHQKYLKKILEAFFFNKSFDQN